MAKSQIITRFVRKELDTEAALRVLKVLLADFPERQIPDWVDHELTGYGENDPLPEYRKTVGILHGNVINYNMLMTNVAIPLGIDTPENIVDYCKNVELRESIGAIIRLGEDLKRDGTLRLAKAVSPDNFPFIMKYSLLEMSAILQAQIECSNSVLMNIIGKVDSKILDLLLELEKSFGCLDNVDLDLESKTGEELNELNSRMIVNIFNNIHIGDGNKITDTVIAGRIGENCKFYPK